MEQELLANIEFGRVEAVKAMMQAPPEGRAGKLAQDALRQQKNLLICTATLVSRAAIRGGMPTETAFSLSDFYIQQAELLRDPVAVMRLGSEPVLDFAEKVARLRAGGAVGRWSRSVRSYVLQHISRRITTAELAAHLNVSRAHLCKSFKAETGSSLAEFITGLRVEEAKRLLTVSQKPLGELAVSLGFSSQSHFQNVFKAATGMTPAGYRARQSAGQICSHF